MIPLSLMFCKPSTSCDGTAMHSVLVYMTCTQTECKAPMGHANHKHRSVSQCKDHMQTMCQKAKAKSRPKPIPPPQPYSLNQNNNPNHSMSKRCHLPRVDLSPLARQEDPPARPGNATWTCAARSAHSSTRCWLSLPTCTALQDSCSSAPAPPHPTLHCTARPTQCSTANATSLWHTVADSRL